MFNIGFGPVSIKTDILISYLMANFKREGLHSTLNSTSRYTLCDVEEITQILESTRGNRLEQPESSHYLKEKGYFFMNANYPFSSLASTNGFGPATASLTVTLELKKGMMNTTQSLKTIHMEGIRPLGALGGFDILYGIQENTTCGCCRIA